MDGNLVQEIINVLRYVHSSGGTMDDLVNALKSGWGEDIMETNPKEVAEGFESIGRLGEWNGWMEYGNKSIMRSSLLDKSRNRMESIVRITESKLRRILRQVISEAQGDGLSDPEVAAAYEELADMGFPDNVNRSDFAVDTDLSFLSEWPYSEALDIMHAEEGSYGDFEDGDTDEERYAEMEASMRSRQNRGMYESLRRILKEHLHGYKGKDNEKYMVREFPPEALQLEYWPEYEEEFKMAKEAIEGNYRKMTALSIDYPKMNTRNVDEDAMDYKHYHEMSATEKYVYCKNELMYLWEDLIRLWKELDEELGIKDGFAGY